ncbi:MAG: FKBP-type peptidyl-prolyl cis-trans isomerase [Gammaproteobacteria bacterium]|nr:FKBP-type peptidyl-prolyl cis-trans isomerase [Gammaproteobacteria bacterium]MCW8911154.1 FKBP-type peptidyl-prolyl cis-trans isomerase [Gammaproteobacteria bacterium]MCW9006199.1 FKBP-type peptidyl-prolyl cis-trans isomerase [Gammaproteobacteria bacterium]MCW9055902.1 FKBP-type peptidyl-prolyl cis-trans isomerase [Gammaproteobacteria bacterium]
MSEQRVSRNKLVQFTYSISDDEGNVIEQVDLPVNYVHGASTMGLIESVERALNGCKEGDRIEVDVPPAEGFGEHDPDLTFADDIDNVPPQFRKVGTQVEMANDAGETKTFVVTKIEDGKLTLDGNHPLAGKTARFSVKVIAIRDATPEEIRNGADNPNVNVSIH